MNTLDPLVAQHIEQDYKRLMVTLRNFISTRKAAIKAEMKALRNELNELKTAEIALAGQVNGQSADDSSNAVTIKDMVRAVLKSASTGLTSTEILSEIQKVYEKPLERTSLSPQLSRMKDSGEVRLNGNTWLLSEKFAAPDSALERQYVWSETETSDDLEQDFEDEPPF